MEKYKKLPKVIFARDGYPGKGGEATMGKSSRKQPMPYDFYTSVNRYKAFIQQNLKESVNKAVLMEFVKNLDANHKIRRLYDHLGFIDELKCYEEQFHSLYKSVDLLPFYKSLEERIKDYSYQVPDDRDTKLALLSAFTSTLSKVSFFENNAGGYMIIDVQRSMSKIVQEISIIEKIGNELMLNNYVKQYNDELNEQIQKGEELITSDLIPQIDIISKRIKEAMTNALKELEMNKKHVAHDIQEAEKAKNIAWKRLIKTIISSALFDCLNLIADVVTVIYPTIGMSLKIAFTITEHFYKGLDPDLEKDPQENIDRVRTSQEKYPKRSTDWNKLARMRNHHIEKIEDWLTNTIKMFEQLPEEQKNKAILDLIETFKRFRIRILEEITYGIQALNDILRDIKSFLEKPYIKTALKYLSSVYSIALDPTVSSMWFYLGSVFDYNNLRLEVDDLLKELQANMRKLNYHKEVIENVMFPLIDDLNSDATNSVMDLSGKKSSQLSLSKFQIKDKMREVKHYLNHVFKDLQAEQDINHAYSLLSQLIDDILEASEKIQKFEDQKKFATFQGRLSSSRNLHDVSDQSLYNSLNELNLAIRASGLLVQFERALSALKQYVFPFAYHFLEEFSSLKSVVLENNFKDILYTVIPQVQKLYSSLDDWVKNINHHDKIIYQNVHFTNYNMQPFYTFTYSENKKTISQLLNGNVAVIRPNIEQGIDKDAVKFNKIRLTFKVLDENIANIFNEVLENFDIRMSHYGYNLYRCGTQYYMIKSGKLTFAYSYKLNKEGRPLRTNAVYKKVSTGGYFLSPFSLWSVQLVRKTEHTFDEFKPFLDQPMDLLLEGVGQFIKSGEFLSKTCEEKMKNYYSKYNEYKDFDNVLSHIPI